METIRIQVLFDEETSKGKFVDALYYPEAEWNAMTEAQQDARVATDKQERLDDFVTRVSDTTVEVVSEEIE